MCTVKVQAEAVCMSSSCIVEDEVAAFFFSFVLTFPAEITLHIQHRGSRRYFKVVPQSEKKCTDMYVIIQNFGRGALWAEEFQLVWKFLANFSHCSLILNSGVYWEMKQPLTSPSPAGSRKITANLFEYFTVRL